MNQQLTEAIVYHILAGFGILPSTFMHVNQSLITNQFLLPETLTFEEDDKVFKKHIYGCQFKLAENKYIKVLLGDCSVSGTLEYALIVVAADNPSYGLYLSFNKLENIDTEPLIAVSVDHKNFMNCDIFLQATFLAAMEKVKETAIYWEKLQNYQDRFKLLNELINFHHNFFEEIDE